jgi:hypothetical protein
MPAAQQRCEAVQTTVPQPARQQCEAERLKQEQLACPP